MPLLSTFWPAERTEKFLELTALGWSASKIGDELGLTRNAVIGKWHRSGIRHRGPPTKRKPAGAPRRAYKFKQRQPTFQIKTTVTKSRLRVVMPPFPAIIADPKRLLDLEPGDCRFPVSLHFSTDYLFCANPIQKGCSYCASHNWLAHDHTPGRRSQPVRLPSLWCAA